MFKLLQLISYIGAQILWRFQVHLMLENILPFVDAGMETVNTF